MKDHLTQPADIAAAGEKLYQDIHKALHEPHDVGKYLAINVKTGDAVLADTPEDALLKAHAQDPQALYHLVRIGHRGVFHISHAKTAVPDRIF